MPYGLFMHLWDVHRAPFLKGGRMGYEHQIRPAARAQAAKDPKGHQGPQSEEEDATFV
jgi:hypothetical protein